MSKALAKSEPEILVEAAKTYADEAIEVIAGIMRTSQNEKVRLLAAGLLLDRAGARLLPAKPVTIIGERSGVLRLRVLSHINNNPGERFSATGLRDILELRSPASAILDVLNTLVHENLITTPLAGLFQARGK